MPRPARLPEITRIGTRTVPLPGADAGHVVGIVYIPVMRANSAAELSIVRAVHPPPAAISWLVTLVFWLGSAGVSVLLVVVGLLVPRPTAVR